MKEWTKKFLSKKPTGTPEPLNTLENGRDATRKLKFPYELWLELSQAGMAWRDLDAETLFAAGLAIGWAEHEESVK